MRLSAFCRMYACGSSCTRGTTMWLPLTWRTLALVGASLTSSSTSHTHGPAALTSARAVTSSVVPSRPASVARHDSVVAARAREPRAPAYVGAAHSSVHRVADDETRVVDARVRVGEAAVEAGLQTGAVARVVEIDAERLRQRHSAAEMVVQEETRANHPCRPQMRLVRQHEQQRLDDVRRGAQQHLALRQRFADEPEFVVLEVAQPAVDQLRAPRRRVRGEIVLLDQQNRESAPGGVARDARAVDAAADDEQVVEVASPWGGARILPDADFSRVASSRPDRPSDRNPRRSRARAPAPPRAGSSPRGAPSARSSPRSRSRCAD